MNRETPSHFRMIAHRGLPFRSPENTMSSFRLAWESGADEFETDVQRTKEGKLVLCHDTTLERYGHGNQILEQCDWNFLKTLDMGSWFSPDFKEERMLLVEELLHTFKDRVQYHLEIKGKDPLIPQELLALTRRLRLESQVFFTSFSWEQIMRLHALSSDIRIGWLVREINDDVLEKAKEVRLFQLCPHAAEVTPEAVRKALTRVSEVRCWGCPREPEAARDTVKKIQAMGSHGITIDDLTWLENFRTSKPN